MFVISAGVCGFVILFLYNSAVDQQRQRLGETAGSYSHLIQAIAQHEQYYSEMIDPTLGHGDPETATMNQIRAAQKHASEFGRTGELLVAKLENDQIRYMIDRGGVGFHELPPVAFKSKLGEPMRRAVSGKNGTLIGLDYRGATVLAAHEYVPELDIGVVAKIDMAEVREPFIKAALYAAMMLLLLAAVIIIFKRTGSPPV